MDQERLSYAYARAVARESLQELELVRSIAHPGEAGRAREGILHRFLRRLCPPGLGLESGFVVDGAGGISGQIDLVLYRPDYYPVFDIGGVKHFPVESVIAVFESKATADSKGKVLKALEQLESVKRLDRTGGGLNYALSPLGLAIDPGQYQCQVFGAVVGEQLMTARATGEVVAEFIAGSPRHLWPNMVVSARAFALRYRTPTRVVTEDATIASALVQSPGTEQAPPLTELAIALANIIRVSVPIDFSPSNYFPSDSEGLEGIELDDAVFPGRRDPGDGLSDLGS